jgi:hypothetical protein
MCPACIANAAVMAAGVGSTGGVLAVCIGQLRKFSGQFFKVKGFRAKSFSLFHKMKEK